jgi:hypothetical protein
MSFASNTLAASVVQRGALVRSVRAIGVAVSLAACPLAAADELQTLISTSLTSGLIDVSALDIDAADRALAVSQAAAEVLVANSRTISPLATGSLMADSMSASAIRRPAMRRVTSRDAVEGASAGEVSDILPLSRVAFPLLVGGLAVDTPVIEATTASLRPLAGPVVGVRSSFLRPSVVASR